MKKYLIVAAVALGAFAFAASASADTTAGGGKMCYELYQPVCAAHQVQCFRAPCYPVYQTYSNSCFAGNANATVLHEGECLPSETGPVKQEPAKPATTTKPYTPPASCSSWNDGCNTCARQPNGEVACTLMYCLNPGPGYCISSTTPPTHPSPAPSTSTSSPVIGTSTAPHPHHDLLGFFSRFFGRVGLWFRF